MSCLELRRRKVLGEFHPAKGVAARVLLAAGPPLRSVINLADCAAVVLHPRAMSVDGAHPARRPALLGAHPAERVVVAAGGDVEHHSIPGSNARVVQADRSPSATSTTGALQPEQPAPLVGTQLAQVGNRDLANLVRVWRRSVLLLDGVERSPKHRDIELHVVAAHEPGHVEVATRQIGVGVEEVVEVVSPKYGSLDRNRVWIILVDFLDHRDRCIPAKPTHAVPCSLEIRPRVRQCRRASRLLFGLLAIGFLAWPTPGRLLYRHLQETNDTLFPPPAIESPEALHQGWPRADLADQHVRVEIDAGFEDLSADHDPPPCRNGRPELTHSRSAFTGPKTGVEKLYLRPSVIVSDKRLLVGAKPTRGRPRPSSRTRWARRGCPADADIGRGWLDTRGDLPGNRSPP